jgi:hypothetical protein
MLACVGLFVTLSALHNYDGKPTTRFHINPCMIGALVESKHYRTEQPICIIRMVGDRSSFHESYETCDLVKSKINDAKGK